MASKVRANCTEEWAKVSFFKFGSEGVTGGSTTNLIIRVCITNIMKVFSPALGRVSTDLIYKVINIVEGNYNTSD
jgi:hypothetical protein